MSTLILKNAEILTMDENFHRYSPGAIVIQDSSIIAIGPEDNICPRYPESNQIDCGGKVLMPGLINAHTHVPMTLLRGLADDLRLDVWLMGYMMPVERQFVSPDFVRLGTFLACAELIRSGVTCFADMYYFEDDVAQATSEAGMRAVCAQTVMKYPTPDAQSYEESISLARNFIQKWLGHPLIVPAIGPHAPYTCTPEIFKEAVVLANEFNVPIHIHLAETLLEQENMRADQGMPVIPYVKKQNLFESKVIAAHCVHVDEGEMRTLLHGNAGIAHNPSSNLKLASGIAPVKKMLDLGLNVGIGTDGPASNNDLDMFEEIRLATFLAKGSTGDPTALPARTTLAMATRLGANAIHLGSLTGSLEPGKRADIILVDLKPLHNSPHFQRDPDGVYAQLVYSTKSTDVTDVMVNGQWLLRDRNLTTLDEQDLLARSQVYAAEIDTFLVHREESVLSKLIAIGGAMEQESFEVQSKVQLESPQPIMDKVKSSELTLIRQRHYRQYDTYFQFNDPGQGSLRFREDDFINPEDQVSNVRLRLTLIRPSREGKFPEDVLLSRSTYYAPATQTLRFYREYFKPENEVEIQKDRLRYLVQFKGVDFFINIDHVLHPEIGYYLEIKSRTWSKQDALVKSRLVVELLDLLGVSKSQKITTDYLEMIR